MAPFTVAQFRQLLQETASELQQLRALLTSGDAKMQLSGRTTQIIVFHNAIAITDTAEYRVTKDLSPYQRVLFFVRNTLDSDIYVWWVLRPSGIAAKGSLYWDGSAWQSQFRNRIILNPSDEYYALNTYSERLSTESLMNFELVVQAVSTPTSGSVTSFALAIPN